MASVVWEKRWERFKMALTQDGVEPRFQEYYRSWVLGWLKFIKPKRFQEADCDDLSQYLAKLAGEGKKLWHLRQALEALEVSYQRVEPRGEVSILRQHNPSRREVPFVRKLRVC